MTLLEQLQQLAPLAAAATPGPWKNAGAFNSQEGYFIETTDNEPICEVFGNTVNEQGDEYGEDDAAFIAAARNLLTPENLTLLVAGQTALAVVAESMRWFGSEIMRMEAENTAMYKTSLVKDVGVCRYNNVRTHTLKKVLQRLASADCDGPAIMEGSQPNV